MKILIAGAGEVGTHLAKLLSREQQEVTVLDSDADKLAPLDSNYNLLTYCGLPTAFSDLKAAGAGHCDLFIAVTVSEASNITACSIAKSLGAKQTVARIDNYEYMKRDHKEFFASIGVNHLIYPEFLAAKEIATGLKHRWARHWFELHNGELIVVGVKLRSGARLCGMQLKELASEHRFFHVSAIKHGGDTIMPRGDDRLMDGDVVYFTTTAEHVDTIRDICGKSAGEVKRVLIVGGSRIAVRLLNLEGMDAYRFKIIESDRKRCEWVAERCPDTKIVHGDGRDTELLLEEDGGQYDAFVALTGSSEANILASLTAKEMGATKTIAEVEDLQFISVAENLNIGTIINKKLLASGKIFQIMLEADADSSKFMALADADVAEIEAKEGSKITSARVKDLRLSHDMTIAGLIRNHKGMLVEGNTLIEPGDHVVVFCLADAIHKVERLFN